MRDLFIAGTGSYLPTPVTNQEIFPRISNFERERAVQSLSKKGVDVASLCEADIFDHWVRQVTGITRRTYLKEGVYPKLLEVEYMAHQAAERALADAGVRSDEIQHIVFSTYTGDTVIPAPVCTLAHLLGIEKVSGTTLNGACAGFLDALIDASLKIQSGAFDTILVVASEFMSNKIDYADPASAILFSDGAGAVVLKAGRKGVHAFASRLKYTPEHIAMTRLSALKMDGGPLVQRKAVQAMSDMTSEALAKAGIGADVLRHIVPHQANLRILEALEAKLKPAEGCTFVKCIPETGNLSSATVPVAIDLLRKSKIPGHAYHPGGTSVLCAVGGGYTFSAVVVDL